MRVLRVLVFIPLFVILARADDPFAAASALLNAVDQQHSDAPSAAVTLQQLEQAALLNNPQVRLAVRRVSLAQSRVSGAGALDDPTFVYRDWGTPLKQPWNLNQAQNMFMFSQTLPGAGKRALRSEIAGKDVDIAKEELAGVRRDVTAQVRRAFYDLLRNNEEVRIHHEQVRIARQALETARVKYTVGRVPQQDVLKAQVALTKLAEHLNTLSLEGEDARAILNVLTGRDPAEPLEIAGEYSVPEKLPSLVDLEKAALESRPELAAISRSLEQSQAQVKLAEKTYTPDYNVSLGYMLMPEGSTFRNAYMAEFGLNLPWLNRRKHNAEIEEAKASVLVRDAELDNQRAVIFLQIQQALIKTQTAQRNLLLYRDTLRPQAQATLKATAAAYENDRTDFLNVLDSQNMTLDVESSYLKAASEFEASLADLELAVGAPIRSNSDGHASAGQNAEATQ